MRIFSNFYHIFTIFLFIFFGKPLGVRKIFQKRALSSFVADTRQTHGLWRGETRQELRTFLSQKGVRPEEINSVMTLAGPLVTKHTQANVITKGSHIVSLTLFWGGSCSMLITPTLQGVHTARLVSLPISSHTVRFSGPLTHDLYKSLLDQKADPVVARQILRVLAKNYVPWRSYCTGTGSFALLCRVWKNPSGKLSLGNIFFVSFRNAKSSHSYYCYPTKGVKGSVIFYDEEGRQCRPAIGGMSSLSRRCLPVSQKFSFIMPIRGGRINSPFGWRVHPIRKCLKKHQGVDIRAPEGTPVYAAAPGIVCGIQRSRNGYGNMVIIRHEGAIVTRYAHLQRIMPAVRVGSRLQQGECLGAVGRTGSVTGAHLHCEFRRGGVAINPAQYICSSTSVGRPIYIATSSTPPSLRGSQKQGFLDYVRRSHRLFAMCQKSNIETPSGAFKI